MEYIRTATHEFATGPALALVIESGHAAITVEGRDVERATVQVVAHLWEETAEAADTAFDQILEGIVHNGDQLTVRTPESRGPGLLGIFGRAAAFAMDARHDDGGRPKVELRLPGRGPRIVYALIVPRHTVCNVQGGSGRIELSHVDGPVALESRSGRVSLLDVSDNVHLSAHSGSVDVASVRGALAVESHSGKIVVRDVAGDARLSASSGSIHAERLGARVEAQTSSGRITIDGAGGVVRVRASSGSILVEGAEAGVQAQANSGSVTVRGPVRGDTEVRAQSGSVTMEVDPAVPFFVEAESRSGSVRSELTARDQPAVATDGAPRVELQTQSGSIRLARYAGR